LSAEQGSDVKLAIVGVGAMGNGMWYTLHERGHSPLVLDRNPAALEAVRAEGGTIASGPQEVASSVDVVVLSLPTSKQVREVLFGDEGLLVLPGCKIRAVVDTTSGNPFESKEFWAMARDRGVEYIDAGITGGWTGARQGLLKLMVGAEPDVFAEYEPIIAWLGAKVFHCGPVGSGHAMKSMINMRNITFSTTVSELLSVAVRLGIDLDVYGELLSEPPPAPRSFDDRIALAKDPSMDANSRMALSLMAKDCDIAVALGLAAGATMMVSTAVQQVVRAASSQLGPDADASRMMSVLSGWCKAAPMSVR
jgi:3-hydroxyisobutyrate dehydrogenase-like beta-hydroxyacid dehydrogenase